MHNYKDYMTYLLNSSILCFYFYFSVFLGHPVLEMLDSRQEHNIDRTPIRGSYRQLQKDSTHFLLPQILTTLHFSPQIYTIELL